MASYLGRNVNLTLLVIIIGVIVGLVGVTVFFQSSLQDKAGTLDATSTDLTSCQQSLAAYQERYALAEEKANETAQDIRKYDQLYEQKVSELEETSNDLAETARQREFEKLQKEKFQTWYEQQLNANRQLNLTIQDKDRRINSLLDEIEDLEDELATCG